MVLGMSSSGVVVLCMLVLAVALSRHYVRRQSTHTLWWAISFWLAFLAAILDFISYLRADWMVWQYKLYLLSAATLVAYMGSGTLYLFSRRLGHVYTVLMTLGAIAMAVTLLVTNIPHVHLMPPGEKAQSFVPLAVVPYFAVLSGVGALALFAGAIYSFIRTRAVYNVWIALGALIFSIGGSVGSAVGVYQLFYVFQAVGSIVLYYGVALSMRSRESM